jgi:chemotaxis protein CheX
MDEYTMKKDTAVPFRWVAKEDLLQRVRQGVSEFMTLCADLELNHEHPPVEQIGMSPAITAMIAFDGDYRGVVWAHCSEPLAVRMATGMMGGNPAGIDETVRQAMGEMINVLGGDVKLFLCHGGCKVDLSLPWVSSADDADHPHFMSGPENLLCSFLHGEERLLVGLNVRKAP